MTLLAALRGSAPGIDLIPLPRRGGTEAAERLRRQEADIAISLIPWDDTDIRRSQLTYETYRVIMRRDHPAAADFDLERWLAYPHIVVSGRGDRCTPLDDVLLGMGRQRRVGIVVPSFSMAAPIAATSDLIAMLPTRCIPEGDDLVSFDPPLAVDGIQLQIAWHRRSDANEAVQHVCGLIRELFV
jgi:DNA-binding transcriptional LysR family regulator